MDIKASKKLTIFPTSRVTGLWLTAFNNAVGVINGFKLAASLEVSSTPPHPETDAGANVQFDLGNGVLKYRAWGKDYTVTEKINDVVSDVKLDPTALHGLTQTLSSAGIVQRAFIFVPATPMTPAQVRVAPGPDGFKNVPRPSGLGVLTFIAAHEMIHALGLTDNEHTVKGAFGDVFTGLPGLIAGAFDKPADDRLRVRDDPRVDMPPLAISKDTRDFVTQAWT
ncbi:hypothetical protein [uncultured Alsobacter sp.]|uniref:hypothetical protein n=1 Tax=uncultured Alsobacter sp. TaxID=1748258 RepID=UPI0025F5A43C|nr:hypothetical protein [uncultured Alsobacter sp.]